MPKPEQTLASLLHELRIIPGYSLTFEAKSLYDLDEVIKAELKGRNRWNTSFWDFIGEVEWRVSCGEMPPVMAELVGLLKSFRQRHERYLAKKGDFEGSDALMAWQIHDYCEEKLEECERKSAGKQWNERNAYRLQQGLYPLDNIYTKPASHRSSSSSYTSSADDNLESDNIGRYTFARPEPVRLERAVHQRHGSYSSTSGFDHYPSHGDITERLRRRLNGSGNPAQHSYTVPVFRIPRLRSEDFGRLFDSINYTTHGHILDHNPFEVNQNQDFFEPRISRGEYTSEVRQQPGSSHSSMVRDYSTEGSHAYEVENRDFYLYTMNDSGHLIRSNYNSYPVLFCSDRLAYVRTSDPDALCYILNR